MNKTDKHLILAVDNAPMFLSTLKRLLEGEPYELHCESTAEAAMTFLEANRPKLILMDIEMPDMDGYELTQKIRRSGNKVPILFVTANHDKEYAERAAKEGAAGLLIKPIRRTQLMEKLTEFVK